MKLSEWNDLCEREWERGREVVAVTLTRESAQDLATDVMGALGVADVRFVDMDGNPVAGLPSGAYGGRIGQLLNVAAGGKMVEYTPLADADTVTVRDADGQTRTVALAAA